MGSDPEREVTPRIFEMCEDLICGVRLTSYQLRK